MNRAKDTHVNANMRDAILPAVAYITEIQWRKAFANLEVHELIAHAYDREKDSFSCEWHPGDGTANRWNIDAEFVYADRMEALVGLERVVASKMRTRWASKNGLTPRQAEALARFREGLSARERLTIQTRLDAGDLAGGGNLIEPERRTP